MKFVADESVDRQVVDALREEGHEVISIAEIAPGIDDDRVLQIAKDMETVLVTCDKDFGELVFRRNRAHAGIILVRLAGSSSHERAATATAAVQAHGTEMQARFTVLSDGSIRIRQREPNI